MSQPPAAPPSVDAELAPASALSVARLSPRVLIVALITVILVIGQWRFSILAGYEVLALCLGTALITEIGLSLALRGTFPNLQSAYVSGISSTLLTKALGGDWWPFVAVPALSIASKYVLTYRNRHLWNPTNFGVCCLVLVAPSSVSVLSHEFGNDWSTNAVIWALGAVIAWRARVLHLTLTYVAAFAALSALRAVILGTAFATEFAPITGPMYQLFIFFMITDPRTVVSQRKWQYVTVLAIAVVEALFRLANDFELPGSALVSNPPAMYALAVVGPLAMFVDLARRNRAGSEAV
jgi:Na+-transporting NADH:ubiquinone oxidoreductase subunit NqrB